MGPALSALDAHIGFAMGTAMRAKDAKRAAQHAAAAQEARSMLGGLTTARSMLGADATVHFFWSLLPIHTPPASCTNVCVLKENRWHVQPDWMN